MERDPKYEGECPRCGGPMPNAEHPGCYIGALSRWDNKTYVCSRCGEEEGMLQFTHRNNPQLIVHPVHGKVMWKTTPEDLTPDENK